MPSEITTPQDRTPQPPRRPRHAGPPEPEPVAEPVPGAVTPEALTPPARPAAASPTPASAASPGASTSPFDAGCDVAPLTRRVTAAEVRAWRRGQREAGRLRKREAEARQAEAKARLAAVQAQHRERYERVRAERGRVAAAAAALNAGLEYANEVERTGAYERWDDPLFRDAGHRTRGLIGLLAFLAIVSALAYFFVTRILDPTTPLPWETVLGLDAAERGTDPAFAATRAALFAGMLAIVVALLLTRSVVGWIVGAKRRTHRLYRLHRFAEANGMVFREYGSSSRYPGMIFHHGDRRWIGEHLHTLPESGRFVEFGDFVFEIVTDDDGTPSTSTHHWGYVAIRLDRPLPNMVLDARSNNSRRRSNLPATLSKRQHLSLEGDFDRYFSLYAPEGYERDALYLFTPEVMALFIDEASTFDVEIVDDWMFFYASGPVVTLEPRRWQQVFGLVSILERRVARWGRWHDERLGSVRTANGMITHAPGVAAPGRRLNRPVAANLATAVGVLLVIWIAVILATALFP